MKEYSFDDLLEKKDDITGGNVFDRTVHISLYLKTDEEKLKKNHKRDKGVDTLMFEAENGVTIILEKDCKTDKILGIEIFE